MIGRARSSFLPRCAQFIVDNVWRCDPKYPIVRAAGIANTDNNKLVVEAPPPPQPHKGGGAAAFFNGLFKK